MMDSLPWLSVKMQRIFLLIWTRDPPESRRGLPPQGALTLGRLPAPQAAASPLLLSSSHRLLTGSSASWWALRLLSQLFLC